MAAIANIVINDGKASPVAHTFAPVTSSDPNGVALWTDRATGIAVGFPVISLKLRQPTKTSRVFKLSSKVKLPVLNVTSPATGTGIQPLPSVAYNIEANIEFSMPEASLLADRKDFFAFVKNYMANAVWTAAVENYEEVF
ncbi:coat protein [ssRNA phage Gephyllon.4_21]|uniref:Coat protein n=2 Tax=Fiersviridae TaxID=2842319 RepID=A0A8S5KY23_9VIRU|nr:coat protein [ssRNA phage Gephyllon.4_21]QDH86781.1 MAG: hypothetical protein H4BulkLitter24450_000002 [Leviviridae sp.]DAD50015.1 TPA_asm: coat protein [ssRNA phage Gephyllon.4_21]